MTLDDIKALHENSDSLTTLVLEYAQFMPEENFDSRLPGLPLIEALSIDSYIDQFSSLEPWITFLLRNYIYLRELTFGHLVWANEDLAEEPALNVIMALGDCIQLFRTDLQIQG
jgi:hypothetical protein